MNNTLTQLLEEHFQNQNDVTLERILAQLPGSVWFVPGIDARTKNTYGVIHEQNLLQKMDMPILPDLLTAEDGKSYYPAFSEKAQAPQVYQEKAEWVELPFEELCAFAANSEITSEIILDPFTCPLALPVTLVLQYAGQYGKKNS